MDEEVDIRFGATDAGAMAMMTRMVNALEQMAQKGKKVREETSNMFGGALADVGKFAAGMLGVQSITQGLSTALNLARNEVDQWLNRARQASSLQLSFADAERRYATQLSNMPLGAASREVIGIAGSTGITAEAAGMGFLGALGGKGTTLTDQQSLAALKAAAEYRPGPRTTGGELGVAAKGFEEIMKRFPGTSAEGARAGAVAALRASSVSDMQDFASYLLPAIVQARSGSATAGHPEGVDSFRNLAALAAGLSQGAEDPSGQQTSTAYTNLMVRLRKKAAAVRPSLASAPYFGAGSIEEFLFQTKEGQQLRAGLLGPLMGATDLASGRHDDFLSGLGGQMGMNVRARAMIPVVEYLRGGHNMTRDWIESARRSIPELGSREALQAYAAGQAGINASPYQTAAAIERTMTAGTEQLLIPNTILGARGTIEQRLPDLLRAAGGSALGSKFSVVDFNIEAAKAQSAADVIRAAQNVLRRSIRKPLGDPTSWIAVEPTAGQQSLYEQTNPEIGETNALLRQMIDKLENQRITIENGGDQYRAKSAAQKAGQQ